MNMRLLPALIAAGLLAGVSTAAFAEDGWYVSGSLGANYVPDLRTKTTSGPFKETNDLGFGLLGAAGYAFGPVRIEEELGWRRNSLDKLKTPTGNFQAGGSLDGWSAMTNAYYDFHTGTPFTPYIGAGIGAVNVAANNIRSLSTGVVTDDNSWTFGYQGIAGVSYAINDQLSLRADYRYLGTTQADLGENPGFGSGSAKLNYASHMVLVGFSYSFGQPPAPPPPPPQQAQAAPAPQPAPAPAPQKPSPPRSYMVFFDFDKAVVTPEGRKIVEQAAANAKTLGVSRIDLTGHTDTVGSAQYNMALSIRRANAVKDILVQLGVPADQIAVVGKGKTDLLVPTADGVREPQNRRVEIVLPQ